MPQSRYKAEGFTPTDNPMKTGAMGLCPRCQMGHLFSGFLKLAPRCEVCGLDYSFADPADGPAFFAMTIAAVPALAFGVWFQTAFGLPLWVHVLVTLPLTVLSCMALLRPLKGWLVCSQFFHKAQEGSIDFDWHAKARLDSQNSDQTTQILISECSIAVREPGHNGGVFGHRHHGQSLRLHLTAPEVQNRESPHRLRPGPQIRAFCICAGGRA